MVDRLPLSLQTAWADLLDRAFAEDFDQTYPPTKGSFERVERRGRHYWYFRSYDEEGQLRRRYVGPDTPGIRARVERHRQSRLQAKSRSDTVQALKRTRFPHPDAAAGAVIEALARAGVFRLRGVLVGTYAYQVYAGMLGLRLPVATLHTGDVDLAQFVEISSQLDDALERPLIEVLREADSTFRTVGTFDDPSQGYAFVSERGMRVEVLVPNRGRERSRPVNLPAFHAMGRPLRFLDFLIYEPAEAVVLHGAGIPVLVPDPARYAVHKLIISVRRDVSASAKAVKDSIQAGALIELLTEDRPDDLKRVWAEAWDRGRAWQDALRKGVSRLTADQRRILEGIGLVAKPVNHGSGAGKSP